MKKVFKFAMAAFASMALCLVSCTNDEGEENGGNGGNEVTEYTGPVQGTSDWSLIGAVLDTNWDTDYVLAPSGDNFVLKNVKLTANDEFKLRYQKDWTAANRGGSYVALGEGFDVVHNGDNIKPGLEGYYDVWYNPSVEQMAVCELDGTPSWKEVVANSWEYVLDISDYNRNAEFHFYDNPLTVNTGAVTFQWKVLANDWFDYGKTHTDGSGNEYSCWANRLGQFGNRDENGWLIRYNNGGAKGSLQVSSKVFLQGDQYVYYIDEEEEDENKQAKYYIWDLDKWHVLTLVADGTNVSIYDNDHLINTFEQNVSEIWNTLDLERFDISMTWDDGTGYPKGQAFLGYLAYTRVWSKALSAAEVAATLCDVEGVDNDLQIYWAFNLPGGTTIENQGVAAGYDLDFTKALAAGQNSYVKADNIESGWTAVEDADLAAVCE